MALTFRLPWPSSTAARRSGPSAATARRSWDATATPSRPAALGLERLSGRLGPALDPCAAIQVHLDLAHGAEQKIVFVLGAGDSRAEAIELIRRHRGVAAARTALEEVWRFWNDKLGVLHAETPDPAMDVLFNGWLPYQVLSCRMWGRSGFYQSGGAYGFRDQLQDCVALLHQAPDLSRQHLLASAARQFLEGDAQHWWHPGSGRGVRTTCSDDYLWLAYAVWRYVTVTGDTGVLGRAGAVPEGQDAARRRGEPLRSPRPFGRDGDAVRALRAGHREQLGAAGSTASRSWAGGTGTTG
jgi:cyclic beta-1,2-glucan synthetase